MTAPSPAPSRVGIVAYATVDGGAEAYLRQLYGALEPLGFAGELFGAVPHWKGPVHDLPLGPKWNRGTVVPGLLRAPRERRAAARVVREAGGFDLIHMQYKREQILMSQPLSELAPVIWTEQGRFPDRRGTGPLRRLYARAARHIEAIVCVSDEVRCDVAEICGAGAPRLEVIPNPVDTYRFQPPTPEARAAARRELGVPADGRVLVTSGRLHPTKRIDLAIEAAGALPDAHLLVAGDGPDRARLEGLAASAGGGRVTFAGRLARPELAYSAGDVFALPSSAEAREGLSLAMLEAAASGLPVVTVRGSGMERYVAEGGGAVAEPSGASVAEALTALLADEPAARAAARRWAEGFDVATCAARHAELMTSIGEGRSR